MQLESYFDFISPIDIRIKGHRIGIDTILTPFLEGFSPEMIAADYPELGLEKIYATITYYYRNQTDVADYLQSLQEWREQHYQETLKNPSPVAERLRQLKSERMLSSSK
ncbi:MAG: DUF433 domain-containing protein [Cyanobacteria bacterium J06643_4]